MWPSGVSPGPNPGRGSSNGELVAGQSSSGPTFRMQPLVDVKLEIFALVTLACRIICERL